MQRVRSPFLLALALLAAACRPGFQLKNYKTNEALFQAALREFERRRWDNATLAFEKLTLELPARDTLLPRAYWYLATAHERKGEHLLAAQSFTRLVETFPDDSLGDDATLETARSYRRLWRKPTLDPTYGETALATYQTLLQLYPDSPLAEVAKKETGELEQWFAVKAFETGMHYFRRKAWDSAIIYFKDVLERYPTAPQARETGLKLVQAYQAIRYREDARELCAALHQRYAEDREVRELCGTATGTASARAP